MSLSVKRGDILEIKGMKSLEASGERELTDIWSGYNPILWDSKVRDNNLLNDNFLMNFQREDFFVVSGWDLGPIVDVLLDSSSDCRAKAFPKKVIKRVIPRGLKSYVSVKSWSSMTPLQMETVFKFKLDWLVDEFQDNEICVEFKHENIFVPNTYSVCNAIKAVNLEVDTYIPIFMIEKMHEIEYDRSGIKGFLESIIK